MGFSLFTKFSKLFMCSKFMGKIIKSYDRFFMVMCTGDFYNESHYKL